MTDKPFIDAVGHPDPIGLAMEVLLIDGTNISEINVFMENIGAPLDKWFIWRDTPKSCPLYVRLALNWIMYGERCK